MDRIPLYLQMHTPEGDNQDAWVAMYEAVGVEVSDEVRHARAPQPRNTRPLPHIYGECSHGVSQCPVHRREYRRELEARKAEQRRRENDQSRRVAAMNVFRIETMLSATPSAQKSA